MCSDGVLRIVTRFLFSAAFGFLVAATPAAALNVCGKELPEGGATLGDQTGLQKLTVACPMIGEMIETFLLRDHGEAFPEERVNSHIRLLVDEADSVATQNPVGARRFAEEAIAAGADREDLAEIIYRTAARDGAEKAVETIYALADLIVQQPVVRCRATGGNS